MHSIKNFAVVGMLVVSAINVAPAFARHHDHDDWDRRDINMRVADPHYHGDWHGHGWGNDWNSNRTLYRNNWNRISVDRQRELDEQMRAQWMAYHHNNWNGQYNWNMYNDPRFLDYLHTSNPGLLGTLRNYIGL